MLLKLFILFFSIFLIYQIFFACKLVENFESKIITNINDLTQTQQNLLNGITGEFRRILRNSYKGNIDDIPIEKKKEINKLSSNLITKLKNNIILQNEVRYREEAFQILKEFLSDISNFFGNDFDFSKISIPDP